MTIKEFSNRVVKEIKDNSHIYITAHKNLDLDALGSMIGLYLAASYYKKDAYLIIDDRRHEDSVKKALEKISKKFKIIHTRDINNIKKRSLLVILDVNKPYLLQNEKLIDMFPNKMIIDHHEEDDKTLETDKNYIFSNVSSTCELLTLMIEYLTFKLKKNYAELLLAGMFVDTNGFSIRTTDKTYEAAYFLTKNGADNNNAQYLLKQNIKKFVRRQKIMYDIDILKEKFAVSLGSKREKYRREDLAKIADILLQFEHIEASFVIGYLDKNKIGISARSMGNIDVGIIMQQLGGGGTNTAAATMMETSDINEVYSKLKRILRSI